MCNLATNCSHCSNGGMSCSEHAVSHLPYAVPFRDEIPLFRRVAEFTHSSRSEEAISETRTVPSTRAGAGDPHDRTAAIDHPRRRRDRSVFRTTFRIPPEGGAPTVRREPSPSPNIPTSSVESPCGDAVVVEEPEGNARRAIADGGAAASEPRGRRVAPDAAAGTSHPRREAAFYQQIPFCSRNRISF